MGSSTLNPRCASVRPDLEASSWIRCLDRLLRQRNAVGSTNVYNFGECAVICVDLSSGQPVWTPRCAPRPGNSIKICACNGGGRHGRRDSAGGPLIGIHIQQGGRRRARARGNVLFQRDGDIAQARFHDTNTECHGCRVNLLGRSTYSRPARPSAPRVHNFAPVLASLFLR
jgi:hypothetical protein